MGTLERLSSDEISTIDHNDLIEIDIGAMPDLQKLHPSTLTGWWMAFLISIILHTLCSGIAIYYWYVRVPDLTQSNSDDSTKSNDAAKGSMSVVAVDGQSQVKDADSLPDHSALSSGDLPPDSTSIPTEDNNSIAWTSNVLDHSEFVSEMHKDQFLPSMHISSAIPPPDISAKSKLMSANAFKVKVQEQSIPASSGQAIQSGAIRVVYPEEAKRQHWEGEAFVDVIVDTNGNVLSANILKSSGHLLLDNAAVEALRAHHFPEVLENSLPIPWRGTIPIRFQLKK